MKRPPCPAHSAFTLIELLVVIAIIAILAGIALPVFNKVQERARALNCAANLRQIGIGMQTYLGDHDDQIFAAAGTGENSWPRLLQVKYLPAWKVFRSPFDQVTATRPNTEITPVPVSYGLNEGCFGVNTSKIVAPSQLIMMAPAMDQNVAIIFSQNSDTNPKLTRPTPAGDNANSKANYGTHLNRAQINVLYADWHVSSLAYREFAQTTDEEGLKRWYPEGVAP